MKEEALIKKWLDNQLSDEELKEFKQLEGYESYLKISETAQFFKAPTYDSSLAYKEIQSTLERKKSGLRILHALKPITKIAAIFVLGIAIYSLFYMNKITTVDTLSGQIAQVVLPDASTAQLNSLSHLSYSKRKWDSNRLVKLDGEAYFVVEKGSRFDVETSLGIVSVLGTQFNVKNRENYFEVKCFEGLVRVSINNEQVDLPAGKTVRIISGAVSRDLTELSRPTWIDSFSSFKSVPFSEVIDEFERQYNVKIETDIDASKLFTGMFVHNNRELALKSISLPFNLEYSIKDKYITLHKFE
jgi:ferric-dicitrate binding protein FerR (iron transport regulator)